MDIFASVPLIGPFLGQVLTFLIGLSIIVAVHEFGHLMVGRWCGIRAEVFSIGFGKVLWSRHDRHGTKWQIAAIPLGGFVKFLGDMDPASAGKVAESELPPEARRHAFHNAGLLARTLTVLAGPVANFLMAIALFFAIAMTGHTASEEPVIAGITEQAGEVTGLAAGDRVLQVGETQVESFSGLIAALSASGGESIEVLVERDGRTVNVDARYASPPMVSSIEIGGAGFESGLRPGDFLLSIEDHPIASPRDAQQIILGLQSGAPASFTIRRAGEEMALAVTPALAERPDPETGEMRAVPFLGIGMQSTGIEPLLVPATISDAAQFAVWRLWRIIADTVLYLKEIALGGADASELSGPIGIAKVLSTAADQGIADYLTVIAFLSTAIGFFNLLPIPVLDGGHLMFYLVEAIRGRPNSEIVVRYGTMIGLSVLLLLMVYVTFNNDLGLGAWLGRL